MNKWPERPLLELAILTRGTEPGSGSYTDAASGKRFLRVGDITGKTDNPIYTNSDKLVMVSAKDVLIAFDGTPGHVATGHSGAISSGIRKVEVLDKTRVTSGWLRYALMSPGVQTTIKQHTRGVTILHASSAVPNVRIPVPPFAEQERIVKFLGEADALRKLRAEADRRTADFIPALFHDMFGEPTANTRNWRRNTFGDLLDRIDGGWSPTCHDRPAQPDEWGVLKLGAVRKCQYLDTENKALPGNVAPRRELEVRVGDLLFTRKNTYELVAACAYVFETRSKLMLSDLLFRLRLKPDVDVNPIFLWGLLTVPSKRKQVQTLASGSAGSMPNISKGRLMTLPIEVAPRQLQEQFASRVAEIRAMQTAQAASCRRLGDLFNSLLNRAFTGKL